MNADKYVDVVNHKVLREMQTVCATSSNMVRPFPILLKKCKKCSMKVELKALENPGNAVDLNPMENVLGIIKNRLRSKDIKKAIYIIKCEIQIKNAIYFIKCEIQLCFAF